MGVEPQYLNQPPRSRPYQTSSQSVIKDFSCSREEAQEQQSVSHQRQQVQLRSSKLSSSQLPATKDLCKMHKRRVKRSLTPKIVYKAVLAHFLLKQKVFLILTGKCFQLRRDFMSWPQQCLHPMCQFRSCCNDSQ